MRARTTRFKPASLALLAASCATLVASCATYPQKTSGALGDFQRGQFAPALEAYSDPEYGGAPFLTGAEAGTVALTDGRWDDALEQLQLSADFVLDFERRALLGSEAVLETLGSWAINDTTKAYYGEGFERVYVHCGLAMAYLAKGLLDDVYVEARLANQLLEAEEKLYDKSYAAGGLGHLISAIAYELIGQPDQAYIDYRRMVEKEVGTELAGRELVHLANQLQRVDDIPLWTERFGPEEERPEGAASVILIAGVGLGPFKVETRLPIPTGDGILPISAATFETRPQPVTGMRLSAVESQLAQETILLESVSSVAKENLSDRILWQVTKSIARGIVKREVTQALEREYGWQGALAGNLFAIFSERADLRSWMTLPDSWQACRLYLPPGTHTLNLEALGGQSLGLGTYEIEPEETLLVFARTLGPATYAHTIGGKPVALEPTAAAAEGQEP
jgi:hypothetical protein